MSTGNNTTTTATTTTVNGKKNNLQTSKAKSRLGVPADHIITWVPFALPADDNAILKAVARKRDLAIHDVVAPILAKWFDDNRAELTEEADDFLRTTEKTPEELAKEIAKYRPQE